MQKMKFYGLIVFIVFFFNACNQNSISNREVTFIKYLKPGVHNSFAAHAISGNAYALLGISQKTNYDFGELQSLIIEIVKDSIKVDSIDIPFISIAFPSNLVINDDRSSLFFALEDNQNLVAIQFNSNGEFSGKTRLVGFDGMAVLAAAKKDDGYWLLINDSLSVDYSTRTYIAKTDLSLSTITILDVLEYNAEVFSVVIGANLFNKYNLYTHLQDYCFIKNYNGLYYFNGPLELGGIVSTITIGLQEIVEISSTSISKQVMLSIPYSFLKEMDISASGLVYPVIFDYQSQSIDFYVYDIFNASIDQFTTINNINPYKELLFAINNTSEIQEKLVVATKYNNNTVVYSPVNEDINFSFGGYSESDVTAAFWAGNNSDQLIIFGNSDLYNQYPANFIIMLPKESLIE